MLNEPSPFAPLRRWLPGAVVMLTMGCVGCLSSCTAGSTGDAARPMSTDRLSSPASSPAEASPTTPPVFGRPVLIETRIVNAAEHAGVILRDSVLGESRFCPGGTTTGGSEGAAITTTLHCSGGTLSIRYAPTQRSVVQGAPWTVTDGSGTFTGLRGGGYMVAVFDDKNSDRGREYFTGSLGE